MARNLWFLSLVVLATVTIAIAAPTAQFGHLPAPGGPIDTNAPGGPIDTNAEGGPIDTNGERGPIDTNGERGPIDTNAERGPIDTNGERGPISEIIKPIDIGNGSRPSFDGHGYNVPQIGDGEEDEGGPPPPGDVDHIPFYD